MMNSRYHKVVLTLLLMTTINTSLNADNPYDQTGQQISNNTGSLVTYFLNLGGYLGFDLTQQPKSIPPATLLSDTSKQLLGGSTQGSSQLPFFSLLFDTFIGAVPVDAALMNTALKQFVPSSNSTYSAINAFANTTFPSYNSSGSPQSSTGTVSVNSGIDQPTYQQDPISQAVMNILGTPDYSFCMNNSATQWTGDIFGSGALGTQPNYPDCHYLSSLNVISNVIGTLPKPQEFFSPKYNQLFLSQLNSNLLTAPLLLDTNATGQSTDNTPNQGKPSVLTAQSQAQQAANFIRYASGSVVPLVLPKFSDYTKLFAQASSTDGSFSQGVVIQAQSTLASYLAGLRVYAAQSSVGFSNLYYILSKRLPQNMGTSEAQSITSQALSEFTMATWRLYNPNGGSNTTWLNQLDKASASSVQKEIATLLAEINYQLYLNRQQDERLLLTNTILLFQNARAGQPSAPSTSDGSQPPPPQSPTGH